MVVDCLQPALSRLLAYPENCLQRLSMPLPGNTLPIVPQTLPIYLMYTPALAMRHRRMLKLLAAVGAPDLTLVGCANRADVEVLSPADRACVHPEYVTTHWSAKSASGLSNGTLSLGLKHQLAYLDIVRRRLAAALVLEDDSTIPSDLWARLGAYHVPADAQIFYVGSYSSNPRGGSLVHEEEVPGLEPSVRVRRPHARNGTRPAILGSNAYVVTLEGARHLLQPVRAETDIQLSLLSPSPLCKRTPPTCYPAASTAGCGEDVPGCAIAPPPRQYGPARWLIWQDPSARAGRGSHNLVRAGGAVPSPSSLDEAEPSQSRRHRGLQEVE